MLASGALLLFALGEAAWMTRSDRGALFLDRVLGIGGGAHVADVVGKEMRAGLAALGVPADSIVETPAVGGRTARSWRVGLPPGASLIQANHAITQRLEDAGARVLSGREHQDDDGTRRLSLVVGTRKPTHEVVVVTRAISGDADRAPARMAIVVYGFGEDPDNAAALFALPVPFAAAIVPGMQWSSSLFHAAREAHRELVLHCPLEPINYPNVNPGPGTILVTMNAGRVTSLLRRHLDQAHSVTAVANHLGSLATQDMTVMTALFRELRRRDLPFIHVNPPPGSVCQDLAADLGVAYDEPDALIDPGRWKNNRAGLDREWRKVLEDARRRGRMMVWIRASPELLDWLPRVTAEDALEGVRLLPLSAVVRKPLLR